MDKRITKTKNILKKALIELMNEKELKKITITDLTAKASINRGTFYLHYKGVQDLVESFEKEIFNDLCDIFHKNLHYVEQGKYYFPLLEAVNYSKTNKDFLKAITSVNGDPNFENKIKYALYDIFELYSAESIKDIKDEDTKKAYIYFLVCGGIGCFIQWINDDFSSPASKIIRDLNNFILKK